MTDVRPFRALRYDTARLDLSRVIVPPYDVISRADRGRFYDLDPHNAIRLELTRDADEEGTTDYSEVRETLQAWCQSGVLVQDEEPALYVMRQRFTAPDGTKLEREGFFAALSLVDYEERVVRPHERTLEGPKADRLKILRAARANLSSVFLLYEDREQQLARLLSEALADDRAVTATDDKQVEYTLAPLTDPVAIDRVVRFMADRPSVIADGHHRYETALNYRRECRAQNPEAGSDAPFERTLAFFANAWAPGSLLLPIHRLVVRGEAPSDAGWSGALDGWLQSAVTIPEPEAIPALLEEHLSPHAGHPAFAADDGSGTLRVFWKEQELGDELVVRVLEREVLGGVFGLDEEEIRTGSVAFPKDTLQAARDVRSGEGSVVLYLNSLSPDDVFRVTEAGEVMPQKSTFFYPKVPSGLVFRAHESMGSEERDRGGAA